MLGGMATCIPPNNAIRTWFASEQRKRQLQDDNRRLQLEDRNTANVQRGPMR